MDAKEYFSKAISHISDGVVGLEVITENRKGKKGKITKCKIKYRFEVGVEYEHEEGGTSSTVSNDFEFADEPPKIE